MFDAKTYTDTRKPLASACTLPSHCYTSEQFFEREVERIFAHMWHLVGREDEFSQPGDFRVVDSKAGSALVCRDSGGILRAFVNACRHRGTRLKDDSGNCSTIVCPYHAWAYGTDGQLLGAPGMEGVDDFDPQQNGLLAVRIEIWGGFVFINYSESAPSLLDWLGDLPTQMHSHAAEQLLCTDRMTFTVNANWKFLIENALEAYHTGIVHRDTLGAQSSDSVPTKGQWDALFVPSDPGKSIATLPGEFQALPFVHGLSEVAQSGTWFTVIYPCTQIVFSQDCVWWVEYRPIDVDQTSIHFGACFPRSTVALPDFKQRKKPYMHRWSVATPEDNAIAEAQQRGHNSGDIPPGRFSLREHCVHALNNWVLDRVLL